LTSCWNSLVAAPDEAELDLKGLDDYLDELSKLA
jgi:hypothetical protein